MSTTTFADQVADLWRTRPVRLPARGPIAGVAAGIGYRYGVDPVLVRVAFVVSSIFGGAGLVLYLAAWLLFDDAGAGFSRADSLLSRRRGTHSPRRTVLLIVLLVAAIGTVGPVGVGLGGSGVISGALMLGGWWLLYQRRPLPPPLPVGMSGSMQPGERLGMPSHGGGYGPPWASARAGWGAAYGPYTVLPDHYEAASATAARSTDRPSQPTATPQPEPKFNATVAEPGTTEAEPDAAETERNVTESSATEAEPSVTGSKHTVTGPDIGATQPPAWDPLGVAPFAWDLPEPAGVVDPPADTPPRARSRFTMVVIGIAILSAAAAGAVAAAGVDWFTPARIGAVALAVIGVGLIIGAFLRRGYGLLLVTAPLLGFVVLASLVGPVDFHSTGSQTLTPATVADLQPEYVVRFGESTIDLRGLQLTEDKTVHVKQEFGHATVLVPENMNVRSHCEMQFGDAKCLPEGLTGGPDGTNGPVLTLDVNGRFGEVEVHRG